MNITSIAAPVAGLIMTASPGALALLNPVQRPPIVVEALSYDAQRNIVSFTRAVPAGEIIAAQWSATVSEANGPAICKGAGMSRYGYDEPKTREWSLGAFVGDPGCRARLVDGQQYALIVAWSPADGRRPTARVLDIGIPISGDDGG